MEQKISISRSALKKILEIANKEECLKVSVEPGGCNGFEYKFEIKISDKMEFFSNVTNAEKAQLISANDAIQGKQYKEIDTARKENSHHKTENLKSGKGESQNDFEEMRHASTDEKYYILQNKRVILEVDQASLSLIQFSEVDYVKELIGEKFVIKNPNSHSKCSCGNSFGL